MLRIALRAAPLLLAIIRATTLLLRSAIVWAATLLLAATPTFVAAALLLPLVLRRHRIPTADQRRLLGCGRPATGASEP